MKKAQDVCTQEESHDWISRLACNWLVTEGGTHVKHVGELKSHDNWSTIGKKFYSGQVVSS